LTKVYIQFDIDSLNLLKELVAELKAIRKELTVIADWSVKG